ncbi:MAG TPA: hypothetical protein DCS93_33805 [Microscillaceae bacterium]|nr:hypothetical protein [Microscillaceae bacterium]
MNNVKRRFKTFISNFGWPDLLVFLIVYLMYLVMQQIQKPITGKMLLLNIVATLSTLIPIYFNHLFLVRRYFDKGKFGKYIFIFIILGLGISLFAVLVDPEEKVFGKELDFRQRFILASFGNIMILLVGLTILLAKRSIIQTPKKLKNQLLIQEMEMKLLKAQLNPHFLFNSLNNIYALSLDSLPETSDMILKLSELMRYQLQSSKKEMVPLEDELNFIRNYVDLERIRLTERADVRLRIEGEGFQAKIAPMLLVPFIENSFKHGIDTLEDSFIHIHLTIEDQKLTFIIENSIPSKKGNKISTKTGLDNTRRRLDLLYKKLYDLKIQAENNTFKVRLELNIA